MIRHHTRAPIHRPLPLISALLSLLLIAPTSQAALSPSQIPVSTQASRAGIPLQIKQSVKPATASNVAVNPLPTPVLSKEAEKVHFILKGVVIEGNTVYPQSELYWVFRNYLDRDVSLGQLYTIAQQITLKYHNDGYVLSKAFIPPQSVKNGIVHVRIVEGFIDKVVIEGSAPNTAPLLQAYGEHVVHAGPLRMSVLERYTLLANDLHGMSVRAILKPSDTTPGAATLCFVAKEDRFEGYVNYNNRGTRFEGPNQFLVDGAVNNIFRMGDNTEFRYANTLPWDELRYYGISHTEQLGTDGLKFNILADYTQTEPTGLLTPLHINDKSSDVIAKIIFPVIRTRTENLSTDASLRYSHATSDIITGQLFKDNVYALTLGATYDAVDSFNGTNSIGAHLVQGLPIFNASKPSDMVSRDRARPDFTYMTADFSRVQQLVSQFSLLFKVSGQVADQVLYTNEEFGIGSIPFGGAYDPSEIVNDDGLAGKLELRYDIPSQNIYIPATQLYTYYDGGEVWSARHEAPRRQSLTSVGLGARFSFVKYFDGYVEFAAPKTREVLAEETVGKGRQGRIFVGITAHLD